jgi:ABC-type dipeptide/oligopeptide/nickel transport system permease component
VGQYTLRRSLQGIPVLLLSSFLVFMIIHLVPGNPARVMAGPSAPEETVRQIEIKLGLDQPLYVQYAKFLGGAVRGDLGNSLHTRRPVITELAEAFPKTFQLTVTAMIVAVLLGVPMGVYSAVHRASIADNLSMIVALLGLTMPVFAVGLILMWVLAFQFKLFPISGYGGPIWTPDGLRHAVLPALTLAFISMGLFARFTRSSMLEVLGHEYVRTARAKGLAERSVMYRHALRNALLPVVTVVGTQFGGLLGGAVVTETIFAWPGLGRMAITGILTRDFPMVQGVVLLVAVIFVLVNLAVDLMYAFLDPRIRYE